MSSHQQKQTLSAHMTPADVSASYLAPVRPPQLPVTPPSSQVAESLFSESVTRTTAISPEPHSILSAEETRKSDSLRNVHAKPSLQGMFVADESSSLPAVFPATAPHVDTPPPPSREQSVQTSTPTHYGAAVGTAAAGSPKGQRALQHALQLHTRVAQIRYDMLLSRSGLEQTRQIYNDAVAFLEESHLLYMEALQQTTKGGSRLEKHHVLSEHLAQAQSDFSTYKAQLENVRSQEATVYNLEFELAQAEEDFASETQKALATLLVPDQPPEDVDIRSHRGSPAVSSQDTTPLILQGYWDAFGDTEVVEEQIYELDQDHQHDVAEYERLCEQELPMDRPVDEIDREYEYQRNDLERQLEAYSARLEDLRIKCIESGINPDQPRKPPSEISSEVSRPKVMPHPCRPYLPAFPAQSEPLLNAERGTLILPTSQSYDQLVPISTQGMRDRVEKWLADPDLGTEESSNPAPVLQLDITLPSRRPPGVRRASSGQYQDGSRPTLRPARISRYSMPVIHTSAGERHQVMIE